jgi:pSer/pThr/pTyr-binding forkhead associated (FHA) protein
MSSYYLIRGTDPEGADRIELGGEMIVGRSDDCDINVQDGHPSRRHARLTVEADKVWLEDLGSANGTFVNDRPVTARTELHHGDRVAFDLTLFVVAAPAREASDATVVRSVPSEPNATVVRPPPTDSTDPGPAAAPPAQPAAPPAPPPPPPPVEARAEVPKSWADPDYETSGTRVLSKAELNAMAAGGSTPGSTAPVQGPHLRVRSGRSAGATLTLDPNGSEWTIGSHAERDLRLEDDGVSAFHAKLSHDDGRWRIIDQMSANGTWVNGDKVTVSYLANGDRIRLAQVECEIHLTTRAGKRSPAAPGGRSTARTWIIAAAAAVATVGALVLMNWLS